MVDRAKLLNDLKPLLRDLEADLRARCDEEPQINANLKAEYDTARTAGRTGATFEEWRAELITQVAVGWVLSCVFVRFLEDNGLIDPPRISGRVLGQQNPADSRKLRADSSGGMSRARDERDLYFRAHPKDTDRDYLLSIFDELARLPGTKDVFGPHNPVNAYRNWLSGDAAQRLIEFFQRIDKDGTGEIIHDFAHPSYREDAKTRRTEEDGREEAQKTQEDSPVATSAPSCGPAKDPTRFLGDLYQDLSEPARKKYALLQTPTFVEEFILDRTLEPALDEFGLDGNGGRHIPADSQKLKADSSKASGFRMIDPACGSGHFLLGGFARILNRWRKAEPGTSDRELVLRSLSSIYGVDLNPYAVAITRFRLLLAAMRECGITRLKDAPDFAFNLACGDALLHGERPFTGGVQSSFDAESRAEHYTRTEDRERLVAWLRHGQYHAVVANPPYITPKDPQQNANIRARYTSCHMKYALSVPFMERIFDLAIQGSPENKQRAGFTGQITSNSFMKREFGKKLVESHIRHWDLTHVIDTSGAYIPGHGTPTVILFGRNRRPVASTIRAVMGIKGEPATPANPAQGLVWTAIVGQIDHAGSQSAFVSVNDTPREQFAKHPWSIGGGGAAELKEQLDTAGLNTVRQCAAEIGVLGMTNADDVMLNPLHSMRRQKIESDMFRRLVLGDEVRDWSESDGDVAIFPYDDGLVPIECRPRLGRFLWRCRTTMGSRATFARLTYFEEGRPWWEWHQITLDRLRTPLSIVYGEVATHNHFVLDRGGKVFKQTAPVIKLPPDATEHDHLALLGVLNSSTACFWLKQGCFNKGAGGGTRVQAGRSPMGDEAWESHFAFNASRVEDLPLPVDLGPGAVGQLDDLARELAKNSPAVAASSAVPSKSLLDAQRKTYFCTRNCMIALQEELDWNCYRLYGLLQDAPRCENPPPIRLGQRAFEIVLARRMAAGEEETTWFARHGSTPITEIPAEWPEEYKRVVQRRIEIIESDRNIALIERPEYKRRWNTEPWEEQQERALRGWLLDRLESYFDLDGRMNDEKRVTAHASLREPRLTSVAQLADVARADKDFMQVAELYVGRMDFDVAKLVGELVSAESVPALPVLRYKPSGLDKRTAWERTWELQRLEDAVDGLFEVEKLSAISSPPSARADAARKACSSLPFDGLTRDMLAREVEAAAGYIAEAVKQNSDLTAEAVLKPVQDAARRAKKAAIGDIPVPPKYTSADFQNGNYWRLRGKLDVPKERWVSFPHCEGQDGSLVIAWAGYDHLQLARAIAERYELAREHEGRKPVPLLAAIGQLIPWLKQWHNHLDPTYGTRMGDYFEGYLAEEAKALGMTVAEVMAWKPPASVVEKRGGRRSKTIGDSR